MQKLLCERLIIIYLSSVTVELWITSTREHCFIWVVNLEKETKRSSNTTQSWNCRWCADNYPLKRLISRNLKCSHVSTPYCLLCVKLECQKQFFHEWKSILEEDGLSCCTIDVSRLPYSPWMNLWGTQHVFPTAKAVYTR